MLWPAEVTLMILVASGEDCEETASSCGNSRLVSSHGPTNVVASWSSIPVAVSECWGVTRAALLIKMSMRGVRDEIVAAADRTEERPDRSTVTSSIRTEAKLALRVLITASIFEKVRDAKISSEGDCEEKASAMDSPREFGEMPTMRTEVMSGLREGKAGRVSCTNFAVNLI